MKNLGWVIAHERKVRRLSLRRVADMAWLSHQQIAKAERGEAHLETMLKIAHAMGVPKTTAYKTVVADLRGLIMKVWR